MRTSLSIFCKFIWQLIGSTCGPFQAYISWSQAIYLFISTWFTLIRTVNRTEILVTLTIGSCI